MNYSYPFGNYFINNNFINNNFIIGTWAVFSDFQRAGTEDFQFLKWFKRTS